MTIRVLQAADLEALLALYQHLHTSDLPRPEHAVLHAVWAEALANPRIRYWGGFVGEALVSSCTLVVVPNLTRGCKPYGLIENVVTHAEHRGRGHAKTLLYAALQHAWAEGCYKVMLLTGRTDEATLNFYDSAGFDRHGKTGFVARPTRQS
jgi:GNAT superfamily N-acetyltransferase